jgi:hypothetical protein
VEKSFSYGSTETEAPLKAAKKPRKQAALLGLGLDNDDGHTRLTRGENFVLYGGSHETHAKMQETAIKMNEQLQKRGKRLEDVSVKELVEILDRAMG